MKILSTTKQQGFTLVELAIVMVIIGLLLGLVLKGQSLIDTAKVTGMANQKTQYQAAYFGFVARYKAIPGDMDKDDACNAIGATQLGLTSCGSPVVGGDGDGRLDTGSITEASALWAHLSAADFIVGGFRGTATDVTAYNDNEQSPLNPLNVGRVLIGRTNSYSDITSSPTVKRSYIFGRNTPVNLLFQLDTKIDDGKPSTGFLRATATSGADYSSIGEQTAACVTSGSASIWDVTIDEQDCNAIWLY